MDRAEASLSEEGRSRLLIDAITDYAIYMLSPAGIITSWNPGAQRLKGYVQDEIVGRHFSMFYTDADRDRGLPAHALEAAAEFGRFEMEGWRLRKDGSRFWANAIIDAIRAPDGSLLGFAKVTRDLTERRLAQQQLENTREQLFQSQKLEAIGQLTGGIAHDFNNLLTAILGSLELARKRLPPDPQLERLVANAIDGASRGAALTGRLLSYARRQELKLQPAGLGQLVGNMSELLQRSVGQHVSIRVELPAQLPPVMTDAVQLETALINLIVNARDAMGDGGTLTVSGVERQLGPDNPQGLKPGHYVGLSVRDEGEGMDAETLAKATEPFFTTKGVGKGTGLGLSMVHGLAEQSGGRLSLESTPGEGTTATIWLPVSDAAPETHPHAAAATDPEMAAHLVVLAVDDDALVLMNTQAMLEDLGHRVLDATSGAEALAKLEHEHVDLVITDHSMPTMTGSELARQIGTRWPEIPIVLATGYAELPAGGATDLPRLAKPFSQSDLARIVVQNARPHRAFGAAS